MSVIVSCHPCFDVPLDDVRESLSASAVRFARMADAFRKCAAMDGLSVSCCSAVLYDSSDVRITCSADFYSDGDPSVIRLFSFGEDEPFEHSEVAL